LFTANCWLSLDPLNINPDPSRAVSVKTFSAKLKRAAVLVFNRSAMSEFSQDNQIEKGVNDAS
jgi:hypothetical protein